MSSTRRYLKNINESELDRPVYRFISFESLMELFLFNKLTLPRISSWDDPYENWFFKTKVYLNDRDFSESLKEVATRIYGQCWSLQPESDAMWRIYSSDSKGVRIATTLRKLYSLINCSESTKDSACLGLVKYVSTQEISKILDQFNGLHTLTPDYMLDSIITKRTEFIHEDEVRVVYVAGAGYTNEFKYYPINPNEFLDSITFDPRIKVRQEILYNRFLESVGFSKLIQESNLYKFTPSEIKIP